MYLLDFFFKKKKRKDTFIKYSRLFVLISSISSDNPGNSSGSNLWKNEYLKNVNIKAVYTYYIRIEINQFDTTETIRKPDVMFSGYIERD